MWVGACREWGYFVGYSEEWLKVIDEAERSKLVDGYTPAYTRHWAIDPKYAFHTTHTHAHMAHAHARTNAGRVQVHTHTHEPEGALQQRVPGGGEFLPVAAAL